MGNNFDKCCGGKGKASSGPKSFPGVPSDSQRQERRSLSAYSVGTRAASVSGRGSGGSPAGDDSVKFDRVHKTGDIDGYVELLSSGQQIDDFAERVHPWAADPKTIGALAATQLAILASDAEGERPRAKEEIGRAGAIPLLVDFLRAREDDREQIAVVALSFLTTECTANAAAAFDAGAMPLLLPLLSSPVGGMQSAAAMTLCNLCNEREEYRTKFVELGGIEGLVAQLGFPPDPTLRTADVQLETVLNLQDLIEDDSGAPIRAYALAAIKAGAMEKLEGLKEGEGEVGNAVTDLLRCLQDVQAG